jgi:hypothetical protein
MSAAAQPRPRRAQPLPRWKEPTAPLPPPYNPFKSKEPWTAIPNGLRQLMRTGRLMGLAQDALLHYLMEIQWCGRKTPREWTDPIGLETLAEECGISGRSLQEVVDDAIRRGLIAATKLPGQREYSYRVLPQNWATAPPYRAAERKPAASADEPHSGEITSGAAAVVQPGRRSRPVELAEPAAKVVYRNDTTWPLALDCAAETGGVVCFSVRAAIDQASPKASNIIDAGQRSASSNGRKSGERSTNHSRGTPLLSSGAFVDAKRLSEIRQLLNPLFIAYLGKSIDDAFVARIGSALGDTPVEHYRFLLAKRLKRARPEEVESGLFLHVAVDARGGFEALPPAKPSRPSLEQLAAAVAERPPDRPAGAWGRIKAKLRESLPGESYANWIEPTRERSYADTILTIVVPNEASRDWIAEELLDAIERAAADAGVAYDDLRIELPTDVPEAVRP